VLALAGALPEFPGADQLRADIGADVARVP
jgi:hypothetical protein